MIKTKELFSTNKKLAYSIVNYFKRRHLEYKTYIDWDDVEQVALMALWKASIGYDKSKGTFKSYAISAIKHSLYNYFSKERKVESYVDIDTIRDLQDDTVDIDAIITSKIIFDKLKQAVDRLNVIETTKQVLLMHIAGDTLQEISDKVGISYTAVSTLLYKHKPKLIQILKELKND